MNGPLRPANQPLPPANQPLPISQPMFIPRVEPSGMYTPKYEQKQATEEPYPERQETSPLAGSLWPETPSRWDLKFQEEMRKLYRPWEIK